MKLFVLSALSLAFISSLVCLGSDHDSPSAMKQAGSWPARREAFQAALKQYPPSDPAMHGGIADLLDTETNDNWGDHEEASETFDDYYDQLVALCRSIAETSNNPKAWRALSMAAYHENSELGIWLSRQPQALPYFLEMLGMNWVRRGRGMQMLAEALNYCYEPHAQNCSAIRAQRGRILSAIRKALQGDFNDKESAVLALTECGTEQDIPMLENLRKEWERQNPKTNMEKIGKDTDIKAIDDAINKIRSRSYRP